MQTTASGSPQGVEELRGVTSVNRHLQEHKRHRPVNESSPRLGVEKNQQLPAALDNEHYRLLSTVLRKTKDTTTARIRELEEENACLRDSATAAHAFAARIEDLEALNAQLRRDNSILAAVAAQQIVKLQVANTKLQQTKKAEMAAAQRQLEEIHAIAVQQIDKLARVNKRLHTKCDKSEGRLLFLATKCQAEQAEMQEKLAQLGSDLTTKQAELQKLRDALQVDAETVRLWGMQGDGLGVSDLILPTDVALLEILSGTNDKGRVHEAQPNEVMQQQEIEGGAITATPSKRNRPANLLRLDETPKHCRPANPSWNCCKVPAKAQDDTSLRM